MQTRLVRFCLISVVTACSLAGADGVLEINDVCVVDGCFPGDNPGLPVEITSPGSYILTGNLTVSALATDGIQVLADAVSIDLNGFSILGPISCDSMGCTPPANSAGGNGITNFVASVEARRLSVRNGAVVGMEAIGVRAGPEGKVESVRVESTGSAGIWIAGGTVRDCTVRRSQSFGILAPVDGVIIGNYSTSNVSDGIGCFSRCVIRENISTANNGDGIDAVSSSVIGNTVSANLGVGLRLSQSSWADNTSFSNGGGQAVTGSSPQTGGNTCQGVLCP